MTDEPREPKDILPRPVRLLLGATGRGVSDERLRRAAAGKVVLVTGASSGVGKATARRLAKAGATVLLVARRVELLDALRDEIEAAGRHRFRSSVRHVRPRAGGRAGRRRARAARARRRGGLERRGLDPALDLPVLRTLPRLRAHDQRQLPRARCGCCWSCCPRCASAARATSSTSARWGSTTPRCAGARTSPPRPRSRRGSAAWRRRSAPTA